ncbi:hypothetical protein [Streptomyces sp. NPDC047928]
MIRIPVRAARVPERPLPHAVRRLAGQALASSAVLAAWWLWNGS